MSKVYLLATDKRIESPSQQEVLDRVEDPVFELVFHSSSHSSSLGVTLIPDVGAAFYFYDLFNVSFGDFYYTASDCGDNWVSVLPEDTLELVRHYDGQDYQHTPRVMFVSEEFMPDVLNYFMHTGRRSDMIQWELEDALTERLGSMGAFDSIE